MADYGGRRMRQWPSPGDFVTQHQRSVNADAIDNVHDSIVAHLPSAIVVVLAALAIGAAVADQSTSVAGAVKTLWRFVRSPLRRRPPEDKARAERRSRFASHVMLQVQGMNAREDWVENRFAELEAEVVVERRSGSGAHRNLPRVSSLKQEIMHGKSRLIVIEGEPGSGKSVTLRYATRQLAEEAIPES